jgi:membrane-associated protein
VSSNRRLRKLNRLDMTQLLDPILTLILNYGYPIVALCVLCGYTGIPIPSDAILMAAGSFTVDGTLNVLILFPLVIITALLGDLIGYLIGWKLGYLLVNKFTRRFGLTEKKLSAVNNFLERWGIWCIFITRWLLTPLAVPVNLVSGISRYSLKKFLVVALIGESLWAGIYIYLGYLFGANWQTLTDYLDNVPLVLVLVLVGLGCLGIALRMWKKGKLF